jgi:hypothetical protein
MPLDITILDKRGRPEKHVPISLEMHWKIVEKAKSKNLDLLLKIQDYYADTEFDSEELIDLIQQLEMLDFVNTKEKDIIASIHKIALEAIKEKLVLQVISD